MALASIESHQPRGAAENFYKIFVVEPHPVVSYAITKILSPFPHFKIVAYVENGLHVFSSFRKHQPQLLLLDPSVSGLCAVDIIKQIKARMKHIKILIFTDMNSDPFLQTLMQLGVQGIVLKTQPIKHLLDAICALQNNRLYVDPALNAIELTKNSQTDKMLGLPHLSPRERQVLKLIAEGLKNREISESFSISIKTVESHRLNLMRKLDAHHVVDLVNWARRYRLIGF